MTPPVAARASQTSQPSLRDRLKDPSLLRDHCYIDGAWVGTPANPVTNPVNGVELAKVPSSARRKRRRRWKPPSARFRPGPSSPPSSAPTSCANGST